MKSLIAKIIFLLPLTALAQTEQDILNGYAKPKPAGQGGMVGTMNPEEMPQAKLGGHGGHRVLTTGDHPIDDHKPDLGHHKPRPDGSVCIEKIDYVEKMERQQIKECWHQNITACHLSSVTEFKAMQQKKCEENTFHKTCKITFKEVALNYTVRTCHKPLVQQCSYRNPNTRPVTKCRTWFETVCNTTLVVDAYGSHKGGQQAWCEKVPKKICAPDHCAMVEGPEVCHDKNIYSTMMKPEEFCDLQPTTDCQVVTHLIPHLKQREICEPVPKEFCHIKLDSPKPVRKPVKKLWCTYPTGEGHFKNPHSKHENPHSKQAALEEAKPMEGSTDGVNNFLDGLNIRTLPGQNA